MDVQGIVTIIFNGCYYIQQWDYDGHINTLGVHITGTIPTDPQQYQEFLEFFRTKYANKEVALSKEVHEMRAGLEPNYSLFEEFKALPSKFPWVGRPNQYHYTVDLDREILTINNSIHWKLGNIPRHNDMWFHAMEQGVTDYLITVSPSLRLDEHLTSPALPLPIENWANEDNFRIVAPKINLEEARTSFLTCVLADTVLQHRDVLLAYGLDFTPDSFFFREFIFALVSIASDQAKFHSFPAQSCNSRACINRPPELCASNHLPRSPGWLTKEWTGQEDPLMEFGSLSHRPGEPQGVSPAETTYWHETVLISLSLVADGEAVLRAANWGLADGKSHFQLAVLSLFKVSLAEVSGQDETGPIIKTTHSIDLSPVHASNCTATHTYNRPERDPEIESQPSPSELITAWNCAGTTRKLQTHFPGLSALVNFFEVAANRRSAFRSVGILPPELSQKVIEFADFETWQSCKKACIVFRACCLRDHRLNDRVAIVGGPFERRQSADKSAMLGFIFKDLETGTVAPLVQITPHRRVEKPEANFVPIIGHDRKAIMVGTTVDFKPVEAS
ncbi:hypothetical protein N7541_010110 [Penicillium brevicompactum]|uniref:Uncharacterized protein n=1 Tax=Penicillium brevicompactum TaxID=5074 RepID=A0A9W9UJK2_PENBR|nr:hypothetical protein N7541_010110 [Penicillium brevicompactum]